MNVLAVSTSTPRGSAALVRDGVAVAAVAYADLAGHAERIFEAIDAVLAEAGVGRGAIDALACDVGPGSFTGVRVGIASAKGMAMGLDRPLLGVVSLEAMARAAFAAGAAGPEELVAAAIDAKKGELFVAVYGASGAVIEAAAGPRPVQGATPPTLPMVATPPAVADWLARLQRDWPRRVVVVGEVAATIALPAGVALARGAALDLPDAAFVGRIALARLAAGERPDAGVVEPLYVRPPDAIPAPGLRGAGGG